MLGEQFKFDLSLALANKENIIQGSNYRFTILSERLIRMEYDPDGQFENRPSELVWYRNMPVVKYDIKQDEHALEIKTKYFRLTYMKEKPFIGTKLNQMSNLRVELLNTDKIWYYGHPEVRNFGSPNISLDESKKSKLVKGLYSIDGFASIDDSNSKVFNSDGSLETRKNGTYDIYLFMYQKDFALCLKDYYGITGYPALIPRYALGNWWSKDETYSDNSLKDLIDNFENKEIPLSLVLLGNDWHLNSYNNKNYRSGFTWNGEYFKNPVGMIKYLHSKGIRLGLNINPLEGIYPYEKTYDQIKQHFLLVKK